MEIELIIPIKTLTSTAYFKLQVVTPRVKGNSIQFIVFSLQILIKNFWYSSKFGMVSFIKQHKKTPLDEICFE